MSSMDVLARIGQIQAEIAALNGGATTPAGLSATATATATVTPAASTPAAVAGTASVNPTFASYLSQAQGIASGQAVRTTQGLSAAAQQQLTSGQQQFATELAAQTGLNPGVISAWLLAEESGGAAQSRQAASNNDWLNIGYTDSGTYGSTDSVWSNPVSAADATAGWLKGQNTIPGYGTASSGIQAILQTAGQSPEAQISALQNSGWASSGYPDLPALYQQLA